MPALGTRVSLLLLLLVVRGAAGQTDTTSLMELQVGRRGVISVSKTRRRAEPELGDVAVGLTSSERSHLLPAPLLRSVGLTLKS